MGGRRSSDGRRPWARGNRRRTHESTGVVTGRTWLAKALAWREEEERSGVLLAAAKAGREDALWTTRSERWASEDLDAIMSTRQWMVVERPSSPRSFGLCPKTTSVLKAPRHGLDRSFRSRCACGLLALHVMSAAAAAAELVQS